MTLDRRVVITGMGAITPLGNSVQKYWDGLINGESGVRQISLFDASEFPCQIAGEVPDFKPLPILTKQEVRRYPRYAQLALVAAEEAIISSGLGNGIPVPERASVYFGTAIGGLDQADDGINILRNKGLNRIKPYVLPGTLPNMAAFLITMRYQCLGPSLTISTACATGTQAIGEASEAIKNNKADLVICGGSEAQIKDYAFAGFSAMRALPISYNSNPTAASRPFDAKREGFIFSEGAGVLILEELQSALKRNAPIVAEVIGYAASSDGYHIAQPHPDGDGSIRAMQAALENAALNPDRIDYINAHGSSTPLNDMIETKSMKKVFGDYAYQIPINSTKSMIGHALGASGSLEAIVCVKSIQTGILHPTINYEFPDPECDLDYVPNHARTTKIDIAMTNSFGLGGQNASLILKKYQDINHDE